MYACVYVCKTPVQSPPLKGRYFDGDTRCDANADGTSPACYGFLEATYSYYVDTTFFRNFELTQALGAWLLAASRGGASRISSIQRSRRHSAPGRLRRVCPRSTRDGDDAA